MQIKESSVFETTIAHEIVKLVSCLDYVKIKNIIKTNYILLLQYTDIPVNIKIFEMLLPLIKAYNATTSLKTCCRDAAGEELAPSRVH